MKPTATSAKAPVSGQRPPAAVGSLPRPTPQPRTALQPLLGTGFTPAPRCQGWCAGGHHPRLSLGWSGWEQAVDPQRGFSGSTTWDGDKPAARHAAARFILYSRGALVRH